MGVKRRIFTPHKFCSNDTVIFCFACNLRFWFEMNKIYWSALATTPAEASVVAKVAIIINNSSHLIFFFFH